MRINKIICIFLTLTLVLSLAACHAPGKQDSETTPGPTATASPGSPVTPLLYRVTDGKGGILWLFGSIHVGRAGSFALPEYVLDAFRSADALAVEFDLVAYEQDMGAQAAALRPFLYTDGTTIRDHIPEALYSDAVTLMQSLDLYLTMMDQFTPILWENLISSSLLASMDSMDMDLGIDRQLLKLAKKADIEILEVESADSQYQMLAGFSPELQALLLESTVEAAKDREAYEQDTLALLDAWASGDGATLIAMMEEEPEFTDAGEEALYREYEKALMTDRNDHMNRWAEQALHSGKEVFICVGAAHIISMNSMVEFMTAQGYTVEQVGP